LDLDDVDWKIIRELQVDGRKTFRDLGKNIGFTGLGAKKRVEKLQKQRVIHPSALVNVETLDLRLAIILLEIESAEAMRKIINRYRDCPRVLNFFTTLGRYNLVALVMAEDQGTLQSEAMEMCSIRSGEGIRRSDFYPINEVNSPFIPLRRGITGERGEIAPCGIDCRGCVSFKAQKCVGCPSASYYKGTLR
jgi:DNA-binding Lrp family transcriptional regulator